MQDRAMQGLMLLALEPVAETTEDRVSLGFRKKRSAQDAMDNESERTWNKQMQAVSFRTFSNFTST